MLQFWIKELYTELDKRTAYILDKRATYDNLYYIHSCSRTSYPRRFQQTFLFYLHSSPCSNTPKLVYICIAKSLLPLLLLPTGLVVTLIKTKKLNKRDEKWCHDSHDRKSLTVNHVIYYINISKFFKLPTCLPGEFHGQRSLVGYSPPSYEESDVTEQLTL